MTQSLNFMNPFILTDFSYSTCRDGSISIQDRKGWKLMKKRNLHQKAPTIGHWHYWSQILEMEHVFKHQLLHLLFISWLWISCDRSIQFGGRGRWVLKMEECNILTKPGPPGGWNLYFIQHCQHMPAASAQHHSSSPALYSIHLFRWFTQKWIRLQLSIGQNTEVRAIMSQMLMIWQSHTCLSL